MKTMWKKLLTLVLALVMLLPVTALAENDETEPEVDEETLFEEAFELGAEDEIEGEKATKFSGSLVWNKDDVKYKGKTAYVVANGKEQKPRFTVKDSKGKTVDASNYTYTYLENVKAGTGYVKLTFKGKYSGTLTKGFKIYLPATKGTTVNNIIKGVRINWKAVSGAAGYVIYRRAWNDKTNGWTEFERWNNTTELTFTDTDTFAGTRYQYGIKAYFARRQDKVTKKWIGGNVDDNYNLGLVGPLKTIVRVTQRKLTKAVAGNSNVKLTWSGSKVFTGYQIKYATDSKFTQNVKTVWVNDPKTVTKTIGSLKNGTTYYFCIRSHHTFNNVKYYGSWSNVLSAKPVKKCRAICIGENEYYDSGSRLQGCVNDMNAMAGMLGGLGGKYTVTKLPNSTKSQIISAIRGAAKYAQVGDDMVFYYSGHGLKVTDWYGSIATDDYRFGALVSVDGEYLTFTELAEELSKVKGRIIVILDSCHSGAAIAKGEDGEEAELDLEAFNQAAIDAFSGYELETDGHEEGEKMGELKQSKFIVLTAASYSQSSQEGSYDGSGNRQGAFTAALIKGMGCTYPKGAYKGSMPADANKNRSVTLKELYDYICTTVSGWGRSQRTQYYGTQSASLFWK